MKRIVQLLMAVILAIGLVGLGTVKGITKTTESIPQKIENYAKENPGTLIGAGAGAATGAVTGAVIGKSAKGAVIGGLLGGLAGGAIGHYGYDKRKGRQQTAKDMQSQPLRGKTVKVESVSASPKEVQPGSEVELGTTYGLLTPSKKSTPVTEKWEITHNGNLVGNPQVRVKRADGTYEARMPLRLPQNAEPGVYEVRSTVKTASGSDSKTTQFRVG